MAQNIVESKQNGEHVGETEPEIDKYDTVVNVAARSQKEEGIKAGPSKVNTKEAKIYEVMLQIAAEREQTFEVLDETETEKPKRGTVGNLDEMAAMAVEPEEHLPDLVTPILKTLIMNIGLPTLDIYLDVRFIWRLFPDHWSCGLLVVAGILANFLFTALAWWRQEPRAEKARTWPLLLLQVWPQYKAVQVSRSLLPLLQAIWLTARREMKPQAH